MKGRFVQIVLAAALLVSCNKNEVVIEGGEGFNMPSVASTLNAFSYSVNAQRLGGSQTIPLTFNKNRLYISAAVSHLTQGHAIFALRDQANGLIHADTFRLAGMYQVLMVVGLPASITVSFQNFSGNIQYALVADSLIPAFHASDFPNSRGSVWGYVRFDSVANSTDSVRIHVMDDILLPGKVAAKIWTRISFPSVAIDTVYVGRSNDTVRIYRLSTDLWNNTKYVFPLQVGKRWLGDFAGDSSVVTQVGLLTTPAGTFTNGFLVEESWGLLNDYGRVETWLVPNVGIVKLHRKEHGFTGFVNERWELLFYHIIVVSE